MQRDEERGAVALFGWPIFTSFRVSFFYTSFCFFRRCMRWEGREKEREARKERERAQLLY